MSNNLNRIYWVAFVTILRREIYRIFWIWPQTLIPPVVTMSLYFVIFGQLIGQRIGEINGVAYVTYLVPGLVMMSVITNSYGNVVSSFFSARFQRQIEEILVAPVPGQVMLLAYVIGGMTRGLLVGSIVMGMALFFSPVPIHHFGVTMGIFILTASLFSLAGFINAIFAKNFDDISIVPTFILAPVTYLGGVFYSIELLPEFWQWVSLLNPILYMVNGFRYGILGTSDIAVEWAFLLVIFFNLLGYRYAVYLLKKGVGLRS
jgi:ABC-2 type transport system permease protein